MSPNSTKRTRAHAVSGSGIGKVRHSLYRNAFRHIKNSLENGFYLEAITLVESLVTDRLESRISYLKAKDFSFKTLGQIISESNKVETDETLRNLVAGRLHSWRDSRNRALHEMAKLADGDSLTWDERIESMIPVAKEGLAMLRAIDRRCEELRRQSVGRISADDRAV